MKDHPIQASLTKAPTNIIGGIQAKMLTGVGIVPVVKPTFDNTNHAILTAILTIFTSKNSEINSTFLTQLYNADRGRYYIVPVGRPNNRQH